MFLPACLASSFLVVPAVLLVASERLGLVEPVFEVCAVEQDVERAEAMVSSDNVRQAFDVSDCIDWDSYDMAEDTALQSIVFFLVEHAKHLVRGIRYLMDL